MREVVLTYEDEMGGEERGTMEEGREGAAGALRARRFRAMLDRRKTHVAFLRICRREIRPTRAVVSSCSRSRSRSEHFGLHVTRRKLDPRMTVQRREK